MEIKTFLERFASAQGRIKTFLGRFAGVQGRIKTFLEHFAGAQGRIKTFLERFASVQVRIKTFLGRFALEKIMLAFILGFMECSFVYYRNMKKSPFISGLSKGLSAPFALFVPKSEPTLTTPFRQIKTNIGSIASDWEKIGTDMNKAMKYVAANVR